MLVLFHRICITYQSGDGNAASRGGLSWSIWWVNSRDGRLQPPVHGRFDAERLGTFYGDDTHDGTPDGTPVRVRYLWSRITPVSARWEQAFSVDGEQTWETNWIMDLTRRMD